MAAALERKRAEVKRCEERIDYHLRMQKERPRIKRIYVYWFHYYRMRRVYWLTDIWLEQCRRWKKEVKRWERPGAAPDLARARILRKSVHVVEDGLIIVEREQKGTEKIARERDWRIRWPRPHRRMTTWIGAKRRRITAIRRWIKRIKEELPLLLHRIKIRLYNTERRKPTPTGMFQTWHIIDALIDPGTGLVQWDWWLTVEEIKVAKTHMVGYFKGLAKWRSPKDMELAYFDSLEGIPYEAERVKYKYSKRVPADFIAEAEALTVGELIVGESSVEPILNPDPRPDNMGVFFEEAMIIAEDGVIKWHEIRNKWIRPPPTYEQVERVKRELGI